MMRPAAPASAQAGHMPHFAAGARLALAVKMQMGPWFGQYLFPTVDLGPDQIFHHRFACDQRRITQRQLQNGAKMLFELRGMGALDCPMAAVVNAWRDL